VELNAFFLKYVLFVPPSNPLNAYRLLFWFLLAVPATREYYAYVADEQAQAAGASVSSTASGGARTASTTAGSRYKRLGPNLWLAIACGVAEVLVIVKMARDTPFPAGAHVPAEVLACWAVAAAAFGVWVALKFAPARFLVFGPPGGSGWGAAVKPAVMNTLLLAAAGALAYLAWSQDVGMGLKA
jgi:phosphatidylserine synthase 2